MSNIQGLLLPLGRWIASQRWANFPPAARTAARIQILNMVAAAHASARSAETLHMLTALPLGDGPSTILVDGRRVPPASAALVNAAFSMTQDFDDIIWIGHTCHSAVFASLAVAEAEGRSSQDLISAVIVANEIAGRIGGSTFFGPLNGQMWTFIHLVGAAAASAWLLGLDGERAAHALAIALAQPPFALQPAFFQPTSKFLAAALPTQIGVQAAYFARAGMTGAVDILEDHKGFWKWFAFRPLPGVLSDLGQWFAIQTLAIKEYPACNYFQTACTAIERACRPRWPKSPDDLEHVVIHTTKFGYEAMGFAHEYAGGAAPLLSELGVGFDVALTAAVLLHAGQLTGKQCEAAWLRENAEPLRRFYARIEVVHDPALTLRVLDAAWRIDAGRAALAELGPRDLFRLAADYRRHYGSSLLRGSELAGWLRAGLSRLRHPVREVQQGDFIPIYFPNRVRVKYRDGSVVQEQVDLQTGSLASPAHPAVLEEKFLREVSPRLGSARARAALQAGLALDGEPLPCFLSRLIPATPA